MITHFLSVFKTLSSPVQSMAIYLVLALVVLLDHLLGPDLSTAIFYLVPIALMTLSATLFKSIVLCFVAAFLWLITDFSSGQVYNSHWVYFWNFGVRLAIFMLLTQLIHSSVEKNKFYEALANKDDLTGILNRRGFFEKAQEEINRAKRFKRPFSLAFIDLDNFKQVNDQFGHKAGDELLKMVASGIKESIRVTDQVGRMGGDEFAVLLVESDQEATIQAFSKCHKLLTEKIAVQQWPVSISAGVITYTNSNISLTGLIEKADEWMYQVKKSGKNDVIYRKDVDL